MKKFRLNLSDLSKYKNEIYGFAILWIVFFHATDVCHLSYARKFPSLWWLQEFFKRGNMGVDIFLFCSGIFLYFAYIKNKSAGAFARRRLLRLLLPVLIIDGWYFALEYIVLSWHPSKFLIKIFTLDFWVTGDQRIWFVSFILVCYLAYPYLHEFLFSGRKIVAWIRYLIIMAVTVILTLALNQAYSGVYDNIEIALTRIPVFLTGCVLGKLVYEKKTLPGWVYIIMAVVTAVVFRLLYLKVLEDMWWRWSYLFGALGVTSIIILIPNLLHLTDNIRMSAKLISVICAVCSKFLSFFGKISINLYLSQVMLRRLCEETLSIKLNRLYKYFIMLVLAVIIAWAAELLIRKIRKRLTFSQKSC